MMKLVIRKQTNVFCRLIAAAQNMYHSFKEQIISFVRVINLSSAKKLFIAKIISCFDFQIVFYVDNRHFNLLAHTKNTFAQKINLFLISKSVFSLSRYIFTCWHFHFLQIARTAAVACYLRYHRSSPFRIVPLHYFLLENFNVFAPFKISIPFSRKHSESLSQTNEHLHAKLFLSPPLPPHKTGAQCSPKA